MATWTPTPAERLAMLAPPEHAAAILAHAPTRRRPRTAGAINALTAVLREIAHRDARDGIPPQPDRTVRTMARLYDLETTAATRAAMRDAYRTAYHASSNLPF